MLDGIWWLVVRQPRCRCLEEMDCHCGQWSFHAWWSHSVVDGDDGSEMGHRQGVSG